MFFAFLSIPRVCVCVFVCLSGVERRGQSRSQRPARGHRGRGRDRCHRGSHQSHTQKPRPWGAGYHGDGGQGGEEFIVGQWEWRGGRVPRSAAQHERLRPADQRRARGGSGGSAYSTSPALCDRVTAIRRSSWARPCSGGRESSAASWGRLYRRGAGDAGWSSQWTRPQGEAPPTPHTATAEEEEPHIVNGSASRVETEHLPQVICCSEVIDIPSWDGRLLFPCAATLLLISSSISHSFLLLGWRSCFIRARLKPLSSLF